jgi:hypothetical protein
MMRCDHRLNPPPIADVHPTVHGAHMMPNRDEWLQAEQKKSAREG